MGLTQSVAAPVRAADEALFGERELSDLRDTFAFLAAATAAEKPEVLLDAISQPFAHTRSGTIRRSPWTGVVLLSLCPA